MPSNSFIMAGAALLSMAFAQTAPYGTAVTNSAGSTIGSATAPTGYYPTNAVNSTSSGSAAKPTGSVVVPTNSSNPDALFCPALNGDVFTDANGHSYIISCGVTYFGSFIDVDININQTSKAKRATVNSLSNCIAVCDDLASCVATSFNKNTLQCAYYSSIGAKYTDAAVDFALVTDINAEVVPSGSPMTSGVMGTITSTISSCAATITNCPYNAGAVVTGEVVVYTTVCPCTVGAGCTVAATPVACSSCAYSVGTATVYSSTVVSGTTTVVPVATAAVAYPSASSTTNGATTTATITCTSSQCQAAATATGVTKFTGAASSVKAGMGMAAIMAIIALVL